MSSKTDQPVVYHVVNRRYSEFLNLQTRLEERLDLRKVIKSKTFLNNNNVSY